MEYVVAGSAVVVALVALGFLVIVALAVTAKRGDRVEVIPFEEGHQHPSTEWPRWEWPEPDPEFEEQEVLRIAEVADAFDIPLDLLIGRRIEG